MEGKKYEIEFKRNCKEGQKEREKSMNKLER